MKINRTWAMPNKNTFTIRPIKELINRYSQDNYLDLFLFSTFIFVSEKKKK